MTAAQRTFVEDWRAGRDAEPILTPLEIIDEDVYPWATAEYWLRVLPTVRVYVDRGRKPAKDIPVLDGRRVSDGDDIQLELRDFREGTWIGERTLRLLNGWQVVFVPS